MRLHRFHLSHCCCCCYRRFLLYGWVWLFFVLMTILILWFLLFCLWLTFNWSHTGHCNHVSVLFQSMKNVFDWTSPTLCLFLHVALNCYNAFKTARTLHQTIMQLVGCSRCIVHEQLVSVLTCENSCFSICSLFSGLLSCVFLLLPSRATRSSSFWFDYHNWWSFGISKLFPVHWPDVAPDGGRPSWQNNSEQWCSCPSVTLGMLNACTSLKIRISIHLVVWYRRTQSFVCESAIKLRLPIPLQLFKSIVAFCVQLLFWL